MRTRHTAGQRWLQFLTPTRKRYAPQVLLELNVLVFLVMVLTGSGPLRFTTTELLRWGANYGPALHGSGVLRLITSEFVHANPVHLVNNLWGLLIAEALVLSAVANVGLIACYLLTGLGGSIVSTLLHPTTVSVGASGAVFGLFGVWLILFILKDDKVARERFMFPFVGITVGVNLLLGAVTPGIDNAAHVGGLATGLLLGLIIYFAKPAKPARKLRSVD